MFPNKAATHFQKRLKRTPNDLGNSRKKFATRKTPSQSRPNEISKSPERDRLSLDVFSITTVLTRDITLCQDIPRTWCSSWMVISVFSKRNGTARSKSCCWCYYFIRQENIVSEFHYVRTRLINNLGSALYYNRTNFSKLSYRYCMMLGQTFANTYYSKTTMLWRTHQFLD